MRKVELQERSRTQTPLAHRTRGLRTKDCNWTLLVTSATGSLSLAQPHTCYALPLFLNGVTLCRCPLKNEEREGFSSSAHNSAAAVRWMIKHRGKHWCGLLPQSQVRLGIFDHICLRRKRPPRTPQQPLRKNIANWLKKLANSNEHKIQCIPWSCIRSLYLHHTDVVVSVVGSIWMSDLLKPEMHPRNGMAWTFAKFVMNCLTHSMSWTVSSLLLTTRPPDLFILGAKI